MMISFCKSSPNSQAVDSSGETASDNHRAENHPRVRSPDGPRPLEPHPGASGESCAWEPGRSDGRSTIRGHTGQEEGGAGGATEASRPPPLREPHPSEDVALPAGEGRPQAASVGGKAGVAAAGGGPACGTRQPTVSRSGLPHSAQRKIARFS